MKSYSPKFRFITKIACLLLLQASCVTTAFGQNLLLTVDANALREKYIVKVEGTGFTIKSAHADKAELSIKFDNDYLSTTDGLNTIPLSKCIVGAMTSSYKFHYIRTGWGVIAGYSIIDENNRTFPAITSDAPFGLVQGLYQIDTQTLKAGDYTVGYSLRMENSNDIVTPSRGTYTIRIPQFISFEKDPTDVNVTIDDFKYFRGRTSLPNNDQPISFFHTVKLAVGFQWSGFTTKYVASGVKDPQNLADYLKLKLIFPDGSSNSLKDPEATNEQWFYNGEVPIGNKSTCKFSFFDNLSAADMKTAFLNAGTYKTIFTVIACESQNQAGYMTKKPINVTLTVKDMADLKVGNANVSLVFKTGKDYQNGVQSEGNDYLTISKTTPYDVYVKASSSTLSSGANNIPVDILGISRVNVADGDVKTISNLSAAAQLLIQGGQPVVDRQVFLQYFISADKAQSLLNPNFKEGTFVVDLTYSFTGT
jgi:hypothetical protein